MIIEIKDEAKKGFCYLLVNGKPVLDIFQKPLTFGSVNDAIEEAFELGEDNVCIVKEKPEPKLYLCKSTIYGGRQAKTIVAYTKESALGIAWEGIKNVYKGLQREEANLVVSLIELPKGVKLVKVDE